MGDFMFYNKKILNEIKLLNFRLDEYIEKSNSKKIRCNTKFWTISATFSTIST